MVPAAGAVTGPPSPWWFRVVAVAAAAPLLVAATVTAVVFQDDEGVYSTTGVPATTVLRWQDRWQAVQSFDHWQAVPASGWPVVLTAVAFLALALAAVRGRPARLAPPESRAVVTWFALGCGAWALGTAVLTTCAQVAGPPGPDADPGGGTLLLLQGVVDGGLALFAAAVAAATVLWCGRRDPDERAVEVLDEDARPA
ncbi:hypothetical protein AB2L28_05015 [Kineococcus sp. TBRC 1896]|uniref:Uncharacterized protein n=1 Tax=Kineococcus mangrovi TaxID=1660183 RepID=A0ABV4I2W0_9ACTN